MRIGELLVAARLVTPEQVAEALRLQITNGGRIGQNLVAIGAISAERLEAFSHQIPKAPDSIAATGLGETELIALLLKTVLSAGLETLAACSNALKLPSALMADLFDIATRNQLFHGLGMAPAGGGMRYELTERGRQRALEALAASSYSGAAPVPLASYTQWLNLQKVTNEAVDWPAISAAFADLQIADAFVDQIGPAVRSGRPVLLYGPPGNGKTSTAQRLSRVFKDIIYVPHAVSIDGQIMRVFDPDVHIPITDTPKPSLFAPSLFAEDFDERWVACRRPFIITGGELTLEMLDLRYESSANFYEAPLHVKAAGGCLLIDDFGRQMVSPTALLNRWIVPLESRVDYMKLHTGKSFKLPFEAIVIFSTNLAPSDLMDPAFLRRIPYKLEVGAPAPALYKRIFADVAAANGLGEAFDDAVFNDIVAKLAERQVPLAAYQPRFLIEQIVASCRFKAMPLRFHPEFVDYALSNLSIGGSVSTETHASAV